MAGQHGCADDGGHPRTAADVPWMCHGLSGDPCLRQSRRHSCSSCCSASTRRRVRVGCGAGSERLSPTRHNRTRPRYGRGMDCGATVRTRFVGVVDPSGRACKRPTGTRSDVSSVCDVRGGACVGVQLPPPTRTYVRFTTRGQYEPRVFSRQGTCRGSISGSARGSNAVYGAGGREAPMSRGEVAEVDMFAKPFSDA